MQERLHFGWSTKIAGLMPEEHVGREECRSYEALSELAKLIRGYQYIGGDGSAHKHGVQRGENTPNAALIKVSDRKAALGDIGQDDSGNQVTGDHKEDIDPGKTSGHPCNTSVEKKDSDDCHCPQTVNVRAVLHARNFLVRYVSVAGPPILQIREEQLWNRIIR